MGTRSSSMHPAIAVTAHILGPQTRQTVLAHKYTHINLTDTAGWCFMAQNCSIGYDCRRNPSLQRHASQQLRYHTGTIRHEYDNSLLGRRPFDAQIRPTAARQVMHHADVTMIFRSDQMMRCIRSTETSGLSYALYHASLNLLRTRT